MTHQPPSADRRAHLAVQPAAIFAILSDASRHHEVDGSGTVRGSRGPREPLVLGSEFGMSMKMGLPYATTNTVVEFEQDRRIAWRTVGFGVVGGRVWRYDLEPVAGGTLVRETWDLTGDKQRWLLEHSFFPAKTKKDMTATLERLGEVVES